MKTIHRHTRIPATWAGTILSAALVISAPAFADFGKQQKGPVAKAAKVNQSAARNARCYVRLSGSAFPQPCDRLGPVPTTAIPMSIIGEYPVVRVTK